jgi:hypothetical protein
MAVAFRRLQRARALDEVRQRLGWSPQRLAVLKTLAAGDVLSAVTILLGVSQAAPQPGDDIHPGLHYLPVRLPYPEMLQQHTLLCIAVDPERIPAEDEPHCRLGMQRTVDILGVGFEWPLLVLCHDTDKARSLLPDGLNALIIDEPMLRELVFAPQPPQTLAGLLLTRG